MSAPTKRLHISPLTPQRLTTILRPPFADYATDITFHNLLTFPEKTYGFVTLPATEADRLKQRLHGSVLQGVKMRVEEARAKKSLEEEHKKTDGEEINRERNNRKLKPTGEKKEGVVPGIEMVRGRKVRRGWTESGDKDQKGPKKGKEKKPDSKSNKAYKAASITGREECLFKTQLPPNAKYDPTAGNETDGRAKKRKRGKSNGSAVVHEFAKNEKHATFLRDTSDKTLLGAATEYVDGKGWVDSQGNVVDEGPAKRTRRASKPKADAQLPKVSNVESEADDDATSSSGTSSSAENETDGDNSSKEGSQTANLFPNSSNPKGLGISSTVERLSITRSSATPPPPSADEPIPTLKSPEPHPLESLFKRPSAAASQTPKERPTLEVSTSFTFDLDSQDGETRLSVPQTPFSQQDIRQRRQRSAAPTPDTAAPGKTFGNVWGGADNSDIASEADQSAGEDEARMLENMKGTPLKEGQEGEFTPKWFYEHRGENTRAWKRRSREAAKEKRQSENRKRRAN